MSRRQIHDRLTLSASVSGDHRLKQGDELALKSGRDRLSGDRKAAGGY